MTTFWSTWICVLTIGSLIGLTWLLIGTRRGRNQGQRRSDHGPQLRRHRRV